MSNTPLKFLGNISGALAGSVSTYGSSFNNAQEESPAGIIDQIRQRRSQRIQDSLVGRGGRRIARRLARQRSLAESGAMRSFSQPTSGVSGIMQGAQVSGGLIGAASSAAAAQEPAQPESMPPADTQGAFDANLGLVRTADPSMMFGANKAKLNAMNDLGRDPYNAFDDYRTAAQRSTAEQAKINNDLRYGRSGRLTGSSLDQAIMRSGTDLGYTPRQGMQERQYDYSKLGYEMSSNASLANLFAGRTALYFKKQKTK